VGRNNIKSSTGSSGHTGGTRPGQTRKKPKDLSASEREERGRGEGGGLYAVYMRERLFRLIFFIFFFKKRKKVSEIETKMFAASVFALNAPFPKQNSYTVRVAEIFLLESLHVLHRFL
jgi:hypothetical protein